MINIILKEKLEPQSQDVMISDSVITEAATWVGYMRHKRPPWP